MGSTFRGLVQPRGQKQNGLLKLAILVERLLVSQKKTSSALLTAILNMSAAPTPKIAPSILSSDFAYAITTLSLPLKPKIGHCLR